MEVSFPNEEQTLARLSGHHTPQTLGPDLLKLEKVKDIPTLIYHIKPVFQKKVERELAKIKGPEMTILDLGDEFEL
jgi:3',5'-cyclic-nucleotide phosphodiesterase